MYFWKHKETRDGAYRDALESLFFDREQTRARLESTLVELNRLKRERDNLRLELLVQRTMEWYRAIRLNLDQFVSAFAASCMFLVCAFAISSWLASLICGNIESLLNRQAQSALIIRENAQRVEPMARQRLFSPTMRVGMCHGVYESDFALTDEHGFELKPALEDEYPDWFAFVAKPHEP